MPTAKPEIVITYCTQCQWLLRAAWLAQELLSTFADDLGKVCLEPGTGASSVSPATACRSGNARPTAASPRPRRSSSGFATASTRNATSGTTIVLPAEPLPSAHGLLQVNGRRGA